MNVNRKKFHRPTIHSDGTFSFWTGKRWVRAKRVTSDAFDYMFEVDRERIIKHIIKRSEQRWQKSLTE